MAEEERRRACQEKGGARRSKEGAMQRTARRQWHQIGYYYHRCVLRHRPCHRHPPCVMGFSNAGFGLRRAERGNLNFFVYVWPIFKLKSVKKKALK